MTRVGSGSRRCPRFSHPRSSASSADEPSPGGSIMAKPLNIGLVGYGFLGPPPPNRAKAHKRVKDLFDVAYRPVLKAVCGRSAEGAKAFAEKWGYESFETDWRKLVERKDIDAVDVCTPNNTHAEIAVAAAQAGKMVLC